MNDRVLGLELFKPVALKMFDADAVVVVGRRRRRWSEMSSAPCVPPPTPTPRWSSPTKGRRKFDKKKRLGRENKAKNHARAKANLVRKASSRLGETTVDISTAAPTPTAVPTAIATVVATAAVPTAIVAMAASTTTTTTTVPTTLVDCPVGGELVDGGDGKRKTRSSTVNERSSVEDVPQPPTKRRGRPSNPVGDKRGRESDDERREGGGGGDKKKGKKQADVEEKKQCGLFENTGERCTRWISLKDADCGYHGVSVGEFPEYNLADYT